MNRDKNQPIRTEPRKRLSVEEVKARQNGLDIWRDVEGWAATGYHSIPEEKFELLKWYGLYRQRPEAGHFMMRVRVPGGRFNAEQARQVASISRRFGRGTLDITVRQNFQIHWLTIEDIPECARRLHTVGLTTTMACGDAPRNIVSCPLAGRDRNEIVDAYPVVQEVNRAVLANRAYSNLPRKFKISISGCPIHCPLPEINDIGLYGATRRTTNGEERGFNLMVGGGLSAKPLFGKLLNAFVPMDKAVEVCLAILEFFRDNGNRENRARSRMKYLVEKMGAEEFRAKVVQQLGYDLDPAPEAPMNPHTFRDHVGIREQKQPGLYSLGLCAPSGRVTPEDLFVAADIAERRGSGALLTSCMQNLLVPDITRQKLEDAQDMTLNAPTLTLRLNPFRAGMVVCTGNEFCSLSLVETKKRAFEILDYLEKEIELDTPIKISISGCPHSCSQYQVADIGLRGGRVLSADELLEIFDIYVDCEMGPEGQMGRCVKKAVPAEKAGREIADMLKTYLRERNNGESFQRFTRRMLTLDHMI